jgi:hypothetical protein
MLHFSSYAPKFFYFMNTPLISPFKRAVLGIYDRLFLLLSHWTCESIFCDMTRSSHIEIISYIGPQPFLLVHHLSLRYYYTTSEWLYVKRLGQAGPSFYCVQDSCPFKSSCYGPRRLISEDEKLLRCASFGSRPTGPPGTQLINVIVEMPFNVSAFPFSSTMGFSSTAVNNMTT